MNKTLRYAIARAWACMSSLDGRTRAARQLEIALRDVMDLVADRTGTGNLPLTAEIIKARQALDLDRGRK